jgi:predicted membrane protein
MDTDRWDERRQRWEQKQEARRARWEDRMAGRSYRSGSHGISFGLIVAVIGFVLLLDNLGFVRLHDVWQYWPALLVAYGVSRIVDSRSLSGYVWGGVVTLIGAFLLLDALDIFPSNLFNFEVIWPVLLIAFGVSVLVRALERNRNPMGAPSSTSPVIGTTAVFSQSRSGSDTQDFHGGEATAVFGAARFDLRNAAMTVDEARIDVNVVFGEVEVRVPETWNVVCRAGVVFAGVNDKTIRPKPDPNVKTPRLLITGAVIFGGITLRN